MALSALPTGPSWHAATPASIFRPSSPRWRRRFPTRRASAGLGCHTERDLLKGYESGQDHLGIYLRNGNEYPETMIGSYRARVAPFNVNYRYVDEELLYLLGDAK